MDTPSLAPNVFINLPSEILLTIFEAQTSFRDTRSLFSTCKALYTLWKTRTHSISNRLLEKQTPCYEDMKVLLQANEAMSSTANPSQEQNYQVVLQKLSMCHQLTKQANYVCEMIQTRFLQQKQRCNSAICRAHPPHLIAQERHAIISAYLFMKLYGMSHRNPNLPQWHDICETKLRHMSARQKHVVHRVKLIMHDYAMPWDALRLGTCVSGNPTMKGIGPWNGDWSGLLGELGKEIQVSVNGCGECVWDDDGVFSQMSQDGGFKDG